MKGVAHPGVDDHPLHACLLPQEEQAHLAADPLPETSEPQRVKVAEDLLVHLGRAVDRPVHFCDEGASVGAVKTVLGYSL